MSTPAYRLALGALTSSDLVTLGVEERHRHFYLIGQTGAGKGTLLLNLLRHGFAAGAGVALLDPHVTSRAP